MDAVLVVLTRLLSGVDEQAEADQDDQQVDIGRLIPGFVDRVVYRVRLVPQPVSRHCKYESEQRRRRNKVTSG